MFDEPHDPFFRFRESFARALVSPPFDPIAMTLATADPSGHPSARIVFLKGMDERGFLFYTNRLSRKGKDLSLNPHAALCIYWPHLKEQIRIEGDVELTSDEESDTYFASRPRQSQLSAWASQQSEPLPSHKALMERMERFEKQFQHHTIPRPPHWGGYRLIPLQIEFWEEEVHRLHSRILYSRTSPLDTEWSIERLNP
ncbi:pyridoxamine 5'-phosphate oxidase [Pajaroellobacter abortibovis]|nr:pyridoxamine 5'-phosphate oxidase [Pajaroellobacter abortibovis]